MVVFDKAHERHDKAPADHDGGEPATRTELFEEQVARDFKGGVGEEEGG